ncbi:MAG: molybdopterin-binding protein [Syntrophomonadaceae bacterium]|jgi:molybdopterin biosynthesis enzyme
MRKVAVDQAIGLTLGHDITRIIPGKKKYRAFTRGHVIAAEDINRLKDLGKEHILVWEPEDNLVHEDDAALLLASSAAGAGIDWTRPNQGRVNLIAQYDGLLRVQVGQLQKLNHLEHIIFSTLHNFRSVMKGQCVAGTRVVPVAVKQELMEQAQRLCRAPWPLVSIKPFQPLWVTVITTGSEVNSGRIRDGFGRIIRKKIAPFGGRWMGQIIVPDNSELIAGEIQNAIAEGAQLILLTGGMSVDADDATPQGIRASGAEVVSYGVPVLPGSQFMLAYQGHVAIAGIPGGALFSRRTTLDLLLPRIFAGERVDKADLAALAHGGLCEGCQVCHYPQCPFGKNSYL